ncbi:nitrous oxide reductase family maturation protein NosD [Riemerella anatipestifer]|nr:nitrous oxide reductase family maturation protein NosD [Riemerella anatipestifer]MBT0548715.1 nitrous oxide reductase family maturation protein NosD [Riemerella anatipestifer]MBT0555398.1 nitrous oxide reductase family maturation protein NosD [Riemerella anatipestifer]MBT0559478.1 nitrous oxide reductase family maturation protein NosD [Riemerella anatipestifer]MDR7818112.1 nitrous oxide reductase family maturation protein NosD [Riemerella anatipestifer]MDR7850122.1 nitrous oxide reductase f
MMLLKRLLILFCLTTNLLSFSKTYSVGEGRMFNTIKSALQKANKGDTLLVYFGHYKEGNLNLDKSVTLIGINYPILDGEFKHEIVSFRADYITLQGFKIIHSGADEVKNIGAVRLYDSRFSIIRNNIFQDNYFGITIQRGDRCLIENNRITTNRGTSQESIGDGIHVWSSNEIWIKRNFISGHKDGIYLEKANNSFIFKNLSFKNKRYGLHFMFSHNNVYTANVFKQNEAGVAVMYGRNVEMSYNKFLDNKGENIYGLLLKDLSFSKIKHNIFRNNSVGVFMDGSSKIDFYRNEFEGNGWGLRINANCMENKLFNNNFIANIFDVSTSGSVFLNTFQGNYWDKYEGYDIDKNGVGDIPFYPLSLYAVMAEQNPMIMILFGTFFVELMNHSEKLMPSLTPDSFVDKTPSMKHNRI